jgi:hypothetical protein
MIKNFRTRQNRCSLFPDFRPENGMNSCRKWDDCGRMGETARGRGSASGVAANEERAGAVGNGASSLRD